MTKAQKKTKAKKPEIKQRVVDEEHKKVSEAATKEKADVEAKAAAKKEKKIQALLKTPLTEVERIEMGKLEAQARQGRFQPAPQDMKKLGEYRTRAKVDDY